MALSERQRNIVNPFAQDQYDYFSERSKWIQAGIHDSYINFGIFPISGKEISPVSYSEDSDTITDADLRAYASLYPQNAKYVDGKLTDRSDKDAILSLSGLATELNNRGLVRFYTSPTSPESYLPQNQKNIDNTSANSKEIIDGSQPCPWQD